MKQLTAKTALTRLRLSVIAIILVIISLFLFSFTVNKLADDFFKQLGISKTSANEKITGSILGGYLDGYGVSNIKNIASGNRSAVVKNLLAYTKQYVNSSGFIKEYNAKKEAAKPKEAKVQTPEEMRTQMIDLYKKSVIETEASIKKADESMKKYFVTALDAAKKQLKEAEDPNNKYISSYKKNYGQMVKSAASSYQSQIAQWQKEYPDNHLLFVKGRLQVFMNETGDIDFDAQLTEKNGKKYFVNREYEYKGNRWKMCFRAGKDAITTARDLVQQWIDEIK